MGGKILVVDDETEILERIEPRLKANGYDVYTANDGVEGIKKLYEVSPDLILLDILMPRADGFKILQILKKYKSTSSIPIVMITAKGESGNIMKAQELQAADYIIKPFKAEELLKVVQRYI